MAFGRVAMYDCPASCKSRAVPSANLPSVASKSLPTHPNLLPPLADKASAKPVKVEVIGHDLLLVTTDSGSPLVFVLPIVLGSAVDPFALELLGRLRRLELVLAGEFWRRSFFGVLGLGFRGLLDWQRRFVVRVDREHEAGHRGGGQTTQRRSQRRDDKTSLRSKRL